jgi:hypothetical protein
VRVFDVVRTAVAVEQREAVLVEGRVAFGVAALVVKLRLRLRRRGTMRGTRFRK